MTTATQAYRRIAAIPGVGPGIVRVLPIDALATTTVTVNALKRGEPASRYVNWYLVRRDAASSADRVRQVTAFDGSTGVLTHAGANYSDTTATSETLELWAFDPEQLDQYAQRVLSACRRYHRDIIPSHGGDTYYLDQYGWIEHRGHVQRLLYNGSPMLSRNPYFNDRNVVSSAGALEADEWTKTGAASSWSWSTTNPYRGPRALTVTRAGTDTVVEQYVGGGGAYRSTLTDGVDDMDGETVTVLLRASVGTASCIRNFINDGSGASAGDYHTGGGTIEVLTQELTLTSPTQISFGFELKADATATVHECSLFKGSLSDAMKRDVYYGQTIDFGWRDRPTSIVPNYRMGRGSCYVLESWRPYPTLDATRLLAGNADADESDIPVDLWAYGIAAYLFRAQGAEFAEPAAELNGEFERLRGAHQWDVRPSRLKTAPLGPRLMRV